MGRPKGSLNKKTIQENLENKPVEMKTNIEELKKEVPTEQKTVSDMNSEVSTKEDSIEQLSGVGPRTAEKLREKGYVTLTDVATTRADELAAVMQIGYAQAKTWVEDAMDKVSARMKLKTAIEQNHDKKLKQIFIETGSTDLNTLLGGGVPTGSITGTVGRFATGKTQIAFDLIVDVLGRLHKKAVFIETEADTFYLDRLKEIAILRGYKDIDWSNLYVCEADQIPTAKAQYLQYKVVQKALEKGEDIILVVVDSFNAMFRAGWSRSEMLPVRTREFGEHFNLIKFLTAKYNVAWYLTFQCIAPPRPEQGLAMKVKFGQEFYPVGGDYVLHTVNNWIGLEQIKTELWKAILFDSSHIDRGTVNFILTKKGLQNEVK